MDQYLIEEVPPTTLFCKKQLTKLQILVTKYISSRIEYYKSTDSNLKIESEFSEWWVKSVLEGEILKGGNYPIDVLCLIKNKWIGIDVGCLCLNGNFSNEKSLIQNFTSAGNDLDRLFETKQHQKIKKIFLEKYMQKILQKELDFIDEFYYVIFVSTKTKIRLVTFKLNQHKIQNYFVKIGKVINKSIELIGIMNEDCGRVKIYKSKKRIELRLNKKIVLRSTVIFQL